MIKLYTDGACSGNPGRMGVGFVLVVDGKQYVKSIPLRGVGTNNQAEYIALIYGVIEAEKHLEESEDKTLCIYSDSMLMVNQIKGNFKVKSDGLKVLQRSALELLQNFDWKLEHIPRRYNAQADKLAKEAVLKAKAVRR